VRDVDVSGRLDKGSGRKMSSKMSECPADCKCLYMAIVSTKDCMDPERPGRSRSVRMTDQTAHSALCGASCQFAFRRVDSAEARSVSFGKPRANSPSLTFATSHGTCFT